jgi:hypothetical protein
VLVGAPRGCGVEKMLWSGRLSGAQGEVAERTGWSSWNIWSSWKRQGLRRVLTHRGCQGALTSTQKDLFPHKPEGERPPLLCQYTHPRESPPGTRYAPQGQGPTLLCMASPGENIDPGHPSVRQHCQQPPSKCVRTTV